MPNQTPANPTQTLSHSATQPNPNEEPLRAFLPHEGLLSLREAAKSLPAIAGTTPAASTLHRWCRRGVKGCRLEYVRVGRNMATTQSALNRFLESLALVDGATTVRHR